MIEYMRIAFVYNFNDSDWFGGRNYFASLFRAVNSRMGNTIQFVFVTGKKTRTSLPEQFPFLEVHRISMMDRNHPLWLIRQAGLRSFDADPLLTNFLRKHRVDLLSHSGYLGQNAGVKTLPWLFDFQFMHLPEHWTKRQLEWVSRRYAAACTQGVGVIVSSEDARNDVRTFQPNAKVPIHVLRFVSNPIDHEIIPYESIQRRYGLAEKYFYLPNQFWTHKNHQIVVEALGLLKLQGLCFQVVCTGNTKDVRTPDHFDRLMLRARFLEVEDCFKVLGVVPYKDTQALMAHSVAVINPSRFEGWSTTVEEAKTLGCRLILSNLAVHREQSPECGRYFDPDDAKGLGVIMLDLLMQPDNLIDFKAIEDSYQKRSEDFAQCYIEIVRKALS